jgi:hypothetical protein
MTVEREALRDWHRLFGLLLMDFFAGSPFSVEVERDLSQQQQFLDVVIVRRRRGKFADALPDGLGDLAEHNLITFKSLHEALDDWAIRELIGYYVAYRKLVSPSPTNLLPADRFRLYGVCARFPHNLVAAQLPWQEQQAGVYDCLYGLDTIRVIVVGQLAREPHNAPLHLFSSSPELVGFGQLTYQLRSVDTSLLLGQLFERFRVEGFTMAFTMEDFKRQYVMEHFPKLTPQEREKVLKSLPPEERLAGLSAEQIRQYLDKLAAERPAAPRKPRRKK